MTNIIYMDFKNKINLTEKIKDINNTIENLKLYKILLGLDDNDSEVSIMINREIDNLVVEKSRIEKQMEEM